MSLSWDIWFTDAFSHTIDWLLPWLFTLMSGAFWFHVILLHFSLVWISGNLFKSLWRLKDLYFLRWLFSTSDVMFMSLFISPEFLSGINWGPVSFFYMEMYSLPFSSHIRCDSFPFVFLALLLRTRWQYIIYSTRESMSYHLKCHYLRTQSPQFL